MRQKKAYSNISINPKQMCNIKKGFTLLEVLLGVSILAFIGVAAYTVLSGGLRSWQKAEEVSVNLQTGRALIDGLGQLLRSSYVSPRGDEIYSFKGEEESVSFVTTSSCFRLNPEAVFLPRNTESYPPEADKGVVWGLLRRIEVFLEDGVLNLKQGNPLSAEEFDARALSEDLKELSFRYYDSGAEEWIEEWDSSENLPTQVEIRLTVANVNPALDDLTWARTVQLPLAKDAAN